MSRNYGKDISSVTTPVLFHLPDGSSQSFKTSAEAQQWFNQNYGEGYSMVDYIPIQGDAQHPIELQEIVVVGNQPDNKQSNTTNKGIDTYIGYNYSPRFNKAYDNLGMNPLKWPKRSGILAGGSNAKYWNSPIHKAVKEGGDITAAFTAAPFLAYGAAEYAVPWLAKNVLPYISANGWLQATQATGTTPAWLTPTTATAIDATLAGSATGASINDMIQNGPSIGNVVGTALGLGGLVFEAAPTIADAYQSGRRAYNTAKFYMNDKLNIGIRRAIYSGMVANDGHAAGTTGIRTVLKHPFSFLSYVKTGKDHFLNPLVKKSTSNPGGFYFSDYLNGTFPTSQILKNSPYEVLMFPERFPTGSRVFNAGSTKGSLLVDSYNNMSPGNIDYFLKNYPKINVRTVQLFPGKDVIPFETLQDMQYIKQIGFNGNHMLLPRVKNSGKLLGKWKSYSAYDSGGTDLSIWRDPHTKEFYYLQEDRLKFNPRDYTKKYDPFSKFMLKILDKYSTPLNVRSNIKRLNVSNPKLDEELEIIKYLKEHELLE